MGIPGAVGDGLDLFTIIFRNRGGDFTEGGTVGDLGSIFSGVRGIRNVARLFFGLDGGCMDSSVDEREFITVRVFYDHRSEIDPERGDRSDSLGYLYRGINLLFTALVLSFHGSFLGVIHSLAGDGGARSTVGGAPV